jgi:hypothetical protein
MIFMSNTNPMLSPGGAGMRRPSGYGRSPLPLSQLNQYNPNRPDQIEAIWQPQYDLPVGNYATTGQSSLAFFQVPFGSGSTPKTYAQTNLQLGGQFPAPTAFLVTAIMVLYTPAATTSQVATAAARAATNWNDVVSVGNSGYLEFSIGGKVYLRDAPIGKFAPNFSFSGVAALSGTQTAGNQGDVQYARAAGRYYEITPFLIPQTQNFSVTLYWPTLATVSAASNIGVIMDGFLYRQSQ